MPSIAKTGCDNFRSSPLAPTRRDLVRIGALGMGGLALPEILRAEKAAGISSPHKAVIMIYMVGAPPHQEIGRAHV